MNMCRFVFILDSISQIQILMIGPHYQRLAEAERQITGKQMLQRVQAHTENPLTMVIDKLKRQFSEYETAYTEDITNHQISSVDRLLSFDGKLGPILAAIQKQNNLLRRQLSLLQSQLSNSVSICQQLITQNNQLKEALLQKNDDIKKIVQTVARNQSESRNQLDDKIALLEQENSILIQHLEEIKKKHQQYKHNFQTKEQEIKKWERKWSQTKKHLAETIDREKGLTRKLAISEHLLFQEKEKLSAIQTNYEELNFQNSQLKTKLALMEGSRQNFDPQALRRTIETEYLQIIDEHKILKNERQNILRDNQKIKIQKQKLEDILNQVEKKFNKVLNQYQLTNNLLNEQKAKYQSLFSNTKKLQTKNEEIKHENIQLRMEVQSGKSAAFSKEKSLESEVQELRRQLHEKSIDAQKKLKQLKVKTQQLLDAKDMEIKNLNDTNIELRRLYQK